MARVILVSSRKKSPAKAKVFVFIVVPTVRTTLDTFTRSESAQRKRAGLELPRSGAEGKPHL